jgi:hypothetical protein
MNLTLKWYKAADVQVLTDYKLAIPFILAQSLGVNEQTMLLIADMNVTCLSSCVTNLQLFCLVLFSVKNDKYL